MKSFFAGVSLTFIICWLAFLQTMPQEQLTSAVLGWLGGLIMGTWVTGFMFSFFSQRIVNTLLYYMRPVSFRPSVVEPVVEVEEDDECDIYNDPNWWKDELKRSQHRRNQDG